MELEILNKKALRKMSVSFSPAGHLFFNMAAKTQLELGEHNSIILAKDKENNLYFKVGGQDNINGFPIRVQNKNKTGVARIYIRPILHSLGIEIKETTPASITEAEDGFYKIQVPDRVKRNGRE